MRNNFDQHMWQLLQLWSEGRQQRWYRASQQDFIAHSDTILSSSSSMQQMPMQPRAWHKKKKKKQDGDATLSYIPVLVEATTALLRQVLGPDIDQSTQTEWSLDVADGTNNNHWWSLQDGNGFDDLLLVNLCGIEVKQNSKLSTCFYTYS